MRNAAFEIASQSSSFAPSLFSQALQLASLPVTRIRNAIDLTRLQARLKTLDDRQLQDIGITRSEIDLLGADGLGARGAIARLKGEEKQCAWICTRR